MRKYLSNLELFTTWKKAVSNMILMLPDEVRSYKFISTDDEQATVHKEFKSFVKLILTLSAPYTKRRTTKTQLNFRNCLWERILMS